MAVFQSWLDYLKLINCNEHSSDTGNSYADTK